MVGPSKATVRLKKGTNGGPSSLAIVRPDGSTVWQHDRTGFFGGHDLTHFSVETELGFGEAFFGLMAQGWRFGDFGQPWPRGPLPPEALLAEFIVGRLDQERSTGHPVTAADLASSAERYFAPQGGLPHYPPITDADLDRVRNRLRELLDRWRELPAGDTIVLEFLF